MAKNVASLIKALENKTKKLNDENISLQEKIKESEEKITANNAELKTLERKLKKAKVYEQKIAELFDEDDLNETQKILDAKSDPEEAEKMMDSPSAIKLDENSESDDNLKFNLNQTAETSEESESEPVSDEDENVSEPKAEQKTDPDDSDPKPFNFDFTNDSSDDSEDAGNTESDESLEPPKDPEPVNQGTSWFRSNPWNR